MTGDWCSVTVYLAMKKPVSIFSYKLLHKPYPILQIPTLDFHVQKTFICLVWNCNIKNLIC